MTYTRLRSVIDFTSCLKYLESVFEKVYTFGWLGPSPYHFHLISSLFYHWSLARRSVFVQCEHDFPVHRVSIGICTSWSGFIKKNVKPRYRPYLPLYFESRGHYSFGQLFIAIARHPHAAWWREANLPILRNWIESPPYWSAVTNSKCGRLTTNQHWRVLQLSGFLSFFCEII